MTRETKNNFQSRQQFVKGPGMKTPRGDVARRCAACTACVSLTRPGHSDHAPHSSLVSSPPRWPPPIGPRSIQLQGGEVAAIF
jgi:hypothetical protein